MEKKRLSLLSICNMSLSLYYYLIWPDTVVPRQLTAAWSYSPSSAESRLHWKQETCSVGRINWITELFVPNEQYIFKTSIIYSFRSSSFRGKFLTFSWRKGCCLNDLSIHRDRDRRQSLKFIPKVVFVIFLMARQTAENQKSAVSCKLLSQSTCCFLCWCGCKWGNA